jgi:hypothetical protein
VTAGPDEAPRGTDDDLASPPAADEHDVPDTANAEEDTSLTQVVSLNPIDGWMALGFR